MRTQRNVVHVCHVVPVRHVSVRSLEEKVTAQRDVRRASVSADRLGCSVTYYLITGYLIMVMVGSLKRVCRLPARASNFTCDTTSGAYMYWPRAAGLSASASTWYCCHGLRTRHHKRESITDMTFPYDIPAPSARFVGPDVT